MAINGNLFVGQTISLPDPKILVNGVEVPGTVTNHDASLDYYPGNHIYYATPSHPVTLTFTCSDPDVHLVYTFNRRTPLSHMLKKPAYLSAEHFIVSAEYDPSNPPTLYQNTTGQNTVVKVRAFKWLNTNTISKIVRAHLTIVGGNTIVNPHN